MCSFTNWSWISSLKWFCCEQFAVFTLKYGRLVCRTYEFLLQTDNTYTTNIALLVMCSFIIWMLDFTFEVILLWTVYNIRTYTETLISMGDRYINLWVLGYKNQFNLTNTTRIGIHVLLIMCTFTNWTWISSLKWFCCEQFTVFTGTHLSMGDWYVELISF